MHTSPNRSTKHWIAIAIFTTLLTACGGGGSATPPPALPGVGAGTVSIDTVDRAGVAATHFFAYQDGDGPWQTHAEQSPGHHDITITDPAGRYSIAVADATTPPRASDVGQSFPLSTHTSTGYIVHTTRSEATSLNLPLGLPPTQLYSVSTSVTTGSKFARLVSVGAFNDDVPFPTTTSLFHTAMLVTGAPYSNFAIEGGATSITPPSASAAYTVSRLIAPGVAGPLDFGSIDFTAPIVPGGLGCINSPQVSVQGAPAGRLVRFGFGLMTTQGVTMLGPVHVGLSVNKTADGAGNASTARTPVNFFANDPTTVHQSLTATTDDGAGGHGFSINTIYTGCNDISLAFPPAFVVTAPTAPTLAPYPRIRLPFTTQPAGSVHVIQIGGLSSTAIANWVVFASTGWFGGAGKAVTWEFPDFTGLPGWIDALWATWATGPMPVIPTSIACNTVQNAISLVLGRYMPEGCTRVTAGNLGVTLP